MWGECGENVGRMWGECGENVGRMWGECGDQCGDSFTVVLFQPDKPWIILIDSTSGEVLSSLMT